MDINGSRILVTGGCGQIGSATVDLLLRDYSPKSIVILDNLSRGRLANVEKALQDPRVSLVSGDIRDAELVQRLTIAADAVIHLAAMRITACAGEPREALKIMCDGSFNVVDASRLAGVKKIIAASSASVYGLAEEFPTKESHHPYNNRTWYGAGKVMLEGLLRSYNDMYRLPYVALRYFNVYGPRMAVDGKYTEVLIRWMQHIDSGVGPLILGDGLTTMDFVHCEDVARSNVLALASDVEDDVFNIASGVETSLAELANALLAVMGSDLTPKHGPERVINAVSRRWADVSKAERELKFRAEIGLEEGLAGLVDWWRAVKQRAS